MRDIVYPVRNGDNNEELRYSLRCIETNYPDHGDVWIVGHKPNWLTNIRHIPGNGYRGHYNWNVYRNILAAAEHPDTPHQFVVFNDDFMVTQPVDHIPVYYHGSLVEQVAPIRRNPKTWWHKSLLLTLKTLQDAGYPDPLSYELHVPFPVTNKAAMAEVLRRFINTGTSYPAQWRTLYGVIHNIGGTQHADVKARTRSGPINAPFHSTTDSTFKFFRHYFESHYPNPSRYEKQQRG